MLRFNNNFRIEARIYQEIDDLDKQSITWYRILNEQGIWLFVSSSVAWSIPSSPLASPRLIIAILLLLFFSEKIEASRKVNGKESFPKCINRIELQIAASNLKQKTRESMLYRLSQIKTRTKGISALKNIWIFAICWVYYGICCLFFIDTVIVSIQDRILESLH